MAAKQIGGMVMEIQGSPISVFMSSSLARLKIKNPRSHYCPDNNYYQAKGPINRLL